MVRRNYLCLISSAGDTYEELYNTFEVIICLIISAIKKDYKILKIERSEFLNEPNYNI